LPAQFNLPFPVGLKLLLDRCPMIMLKVCRVDLDGKRVDVAPPDAILHQQIESCIDYLSKAAQFLSDCLRLANQCGQNSVLGPLPIEKVSTIDIRVGLQLAIDASIPLLHPAGIPGDIEMKDVPTVRLEIQPFAGSIRGDEYADEMLRRVGIEGGLDDLAFSDRSWAVEDRNALVCTISTRDCRRELLLEVSLGIVVLGEKDDADIVPTSSL